MKISITNKIQRENKVENNNNEDLKQCDEDIKLIFEEKNILLAYAHEICEHITFLFECREEDNTAINGNKCFGFRYYNHLNNK